MYVVPNDRKNAKKPQDNQITKRKKVVLSFVEREDLIHKSKNAFKNKLSVDYGIAMRT